MVVDVSKQGPERSVGFVWNPILFFGVVLVYLSFLVSKMKMLMIRRHSFNHVPQERRID
jgi:hypothetical protein